MTADGFNSDRDAEMVREVHATGVRVEAVLDQLRCEQRQTGERVAAAQQRVTGLAETVDTLSALTARLTDDNLRLAGENAALRAALAPFGRMAWYFAEELKHVGDGHPLNQYDPDSATLGDAKRAAKLAGVPAVRPFDATDQEQE